MEADITLVTHEHEDHNNWKEIKGQAFLIKNPGEYEIKDVFIRGISSFHDDSQGKERGKNTIYIVEAEGLKVCHLGDLGQGELSASQVEKIGNIDILFVPVGGVYTIDAKAAAKIVRQIEPRMVVPMHYALPKLKYSLAKADDFFHTLGIKNVESQAKLALKARDLSGDEMKVIMLTP